MFDSHAHVAAEEFDTDREEVVKRALAQGLSGWMEVGTSVEDSKKAIAIAHQYEGVVASVGVHPNDIASLNEESWDVLRELAQDPKVKAIGEVGLDFYYGGKAEDQLPVLRTFISLAERQELPLIFHVRSSSTHDAHEELLSLLESYQTAQHIPGVIHTYSGTVDQVQRYLERGLYISFSGVITFKKAEELVKVAAMVPADRMLIETDCPFLTPMPHRGKRNEPAYVRLIAQKLADIRGEDVQVLSAQTVVNAQKLFTL